MKKITFLVSVTIILLISMNCSKNDIEKEKQNIINTDIEFSVYSRKYGMQKAFLEYIDSNGIILRDGRMPIIGKNELIEVYKKSSDSGFMLSWEPKFADISESCDMGYTWGIWTLIQDTSVYQGTYTTFWKKDKQGKWKFVMDVGTDGL